MKKLYIILIFLFAIQVQAQQEGMLTMYEDGLLKCLDGETSFEEVIRVSHA